MWVVGHAQVGWFMARACKVEARDRKLVALACMLPDVDGLTILGGYDLYFAGHHVWLHSVFAAALFAALMAVFARRRLLVAALSLLGVLLHLLSDGFGLLALAPLWPVSTWIFWPNDGRYWVAFVGEVIVPALLIAAQVALARREGTSILELLPARAEGWVRARLRERFGGG